MIDILLIIFCPVVLAVVNRLRGSDYGELINVSLTIKRLFFGLCFAIFSTYFFSLDGFDFGLVWIFSFLAWVSGRPSDMLNVNDMTYGGAYRGVITCIPFYAMGLYDVIPFVIFPFLLQGVGTSLGKFLAKDIEDWHPEVNEATEISEIFLGFVVGFGMSLKYLIDIM